MDHDQHLTEWIERLRDGDSEAKEIIFRQHFEQLVRYARKRLKGLPSRERDEEDVALSVLDTFIRRINDGQYTWVADREDLWRALYDVAAKRVAKEFRRQLAEKRGAARSARNRSSTRPRGRARASVALPAMLTVANSLPISSRKRAPNYLPNSADSPRGKNWSRLPSIAWRTTRCKKWRINWTSQRLP